MPTYDYKCSCGEIEPDYITGIGGPHPECPECGSVMSRCFGAPAVIGVMPSKPIVSKQLGMTFETNAAYRSYLKSKGLTDCDKSDSTIQSMRDRARNAADATARKSGYRDHEDKVAKRKAAKLAKA